MNERPIETVLAACERELAAGHLPDLRAAGFWGAVNAVKRRPDLVARHADRIAVIDRAAFRGRVRLHVPVVLGVALLVLGSLFGLVALWLAAAFAHPARELLVLVGMGALLLCTHNLGHFVYGSAVGIRFTDWFIDLPRRPPGLKVDYASYLRTPAARRAWMHAAGAIVSKIVPFAVVPYALSIGCDGWGVVLLVTAGISGILTDVLFSVKASDWKKFRREMKLAHQAP